jgi:hypothetical protein
MIPVVPLPLPPGPLAWTSIAGVIAGIIGTASGEVTVRVDSWAPAAGVAAGLVVAFRLGAWLYGRRAGAVLAVVRSFLAEVAVYHRLAADGEITDEEAHELAGAVGRFVADLEALGELACAGEGPP